MSCPALMHKVNGSFKKNLMSIIIAIHLLPISTRTSRLHYLAFRESSRLSWRDQAVTKNQGPFEAPTADAGRLCSKLSRAKASLNKG